MIEQESSSGLQWGPGKRANNGDIEIAYWVFGEGAPLVMITGLVTPATSWGPLPKILSDQGYKVLAIDNRDIGRSSRCDDLEYEVADMAKDVVGVLDVEGIERAYVLGISLGGMIAQELALDFPERVEKLMLLGTDAGFPVRIVDEAFWMSFLFLPASDAETYLRALVEMITAPGFAESNPEMVDLIVKSRIEAFADAGQLNRQILASTSFSSGDRLHDLRVPTLIVHGDQDRMVPTANGPLLAELIPDSELVILEGVGHLSPLEAPVEVFGLIARFFPVKEQVQG